MKRLTRVLVYEGPDDWIDDCIAKRVIQGATPLTWLYPPKTIIEKTMTVEPLSDVSTQPPEKNQ